MSAAPDANADDDGFDPNALLQRFGERLRELDRPVDLSISLDVLQARRAVPTTPTTPAPRSQLRPERWNMDDVTDVEDQSERRRAQAARALEQTRLAEVQAQELAQRQARQQAREAEECAAAEALAQARARLQAQRQAAQASAELALAAITLPRVPPAAPLDLDELGGLMRQLAREAADYQRQPLSRAASSSSGTAASTPAPL